MDSNADTLSLIFGKLKWNKYLKKYWHSKNEIIMFGNAITKGYEKCNPIPVRTFSLERFEKWIKKFEDECKKIAEEKGENDFTRETIYKSLLADYMTSYEVYLDSVSTSQKDEELETFASAYYENEFERY